MLAGDNSILQKATDAKEYTERAEIVENAKMDVLNEITGNKGNGLQKSQLKDVLKKYFVNSGIPEELPPDLSTLELTTLNNKYKIKVSEIYDGTFGNKTEDTNYAPYDNPYIPTNFSHVSGTTWNAGFTIKGDAGTDNANDEFVWVPCVIDQSKVKPGDTVQTFEKITTGNYNSLDFVLNPAGGTNDEVGEEDLSVSEIRASVGTYGGFYIAKYEAGLSGDKDNNTLLISLGLGKTKEDGSIKPLSQPGKGVWNIISRENSLIVSKAMIPASTGAKSTLISGECWDTTLAWITATTDSTFAENGTDKGWYGDEVHTTGYYGINNVFDLGGNVWEHTTERCYCDDGDGSMMHDDVIRGGWYASYSKTSYPPAYRNNLYGNIDVIYGFRVVLYK